MARLILRLFYDPHGERRDIVVDLATDADTVAFEHEQQHKALVEKQIESGLIKASEAGKIVVELEEDAKEPPLPSVRAMLAPTGRSNASSAGSNVTPRGPDPAGAATRKLSCSQQKL